VQGEVLRLINDLITRNGMGLIFISHDLNLVSQFCDRILVMYRGKIVEECAAGALEKARHPYTRGLLASVPRIDETRAELPVLDRGAWAGA
jgi:peptide/nickel transport system ATP-binding protein